MTKPSNPLYGKFEEVVDALLRGKRPRKADKAADRSERGGIVRERPEDEESAGGEG
ncbi:MAG: hypothetical protein OXU69_08850 [Gemmatimonadota bacterium]|nr:hypothetical protein [Gemmatimonadota bacterium]MDE2984801.1 hypothetical protein [Gemmatimonadota bacterium]